MPKKQQLVKCGTCGEYRTAQHAVEHKKQKAAQDKELVKKLQEAMHSIRKGRY
jgi:hypothetical protein